MAYNYFNPGAEADPGTYDGYWPTDTTPAGDPKLAEGTKGDVNTGAGWEALPTDGRESPPIPTKTPTPTRGVITGNPWRNQTGVFAQLMSTIWRAQHPGYDDNGTPIPGYVPPTTGDKPTESQDLSADGSNGTPPANTNPGDGPLDGDDYGTLTPPGDKYDGGDKGGGGLGGRYEIVGSPEDFKFMQDINPATGRSYFQDAIAAAQSGGQRAREGFQTAYGAAMERPTDMTGQNFNRNAFMNNFLGNEGALAQVAQGRTSALGNTLNHIAARQARLGGEAALAAMPGAKNSGAGMAAFGEAYANPFAQAQAQQQAAQLGLYQNLAGQAMNQYGANEQFGTDLMKQYDFQNALQKNAYQDRAAQLASQLAGQEQAYAGLEGQLASGATQWYQPTYAAQKGLMDYITQGIAALAPWFQK